MSLIKQYFTLNKEFQLCTLTDLQHEDYTSWNWQGRELTSWNDDNNETYDLDKPVSFDRQYVNMSANWVLTKHPISAYIPSEHGHVRITLKNTELPLATTEQPYNTSFTLSNEQVGNIWYDSNLSIDLVPDDDYKATSFKVNNIEANLDNQYVYNGTTKNDNININAYFYIDTTKAGLCASTSSETFKIPYDDIPQPLAFTSSKNVIQEPFASQANINQNSIINIIDNHGIISSIDIYAFSNCVNMSLVQMSNISSIGMHAFENCSSLISIDLPYAELMGNNAFSNCVNMSSVQMSNILSISHYAFENCSSLISIDLPYAELMGNNAFSNCYSLLSINCDNVKRIDTNTFYNCYSLSSLNLPELSTLKSMIGQFTYCSSLTGMYCPNVLCLDFNSSYLTAYAFTGCDNLISIYIDNDNIKSIDNGYDNPNQLIVDNTNKLLYAVQGIINISNDNINYVNDYAFYNHIKLSSIYLSNILSIGNYAFQFANLCSLYSPNVNYIGNEAFKYACGPKKVELPNLSTLSYRSTFESNTGIETADMPVLSVVNRSTFLSCNNLKSFDGPNVLSVCDAAFKGCYLLSSVNIPEVKQIGTIQFNYNGVFTDCWSLISLSCGNLSSIGGVSGFSEQDYTFENCYSLSSIYFPNLQLINGKYTFKTCSSLISIDLPELVYITGDQIFYNCMSLKYANMPKLSCIQDGAYYFNNCYNLISVNLDSLLSINNATYTFNNCSSLTDIHFPSLTTIDLQQNTSYVKLFENCYNLSVFDAPSLQQCNKCSYMFENCYNLSVFNAPLLQHTNSSYAMFKNCKNINYIDAPFIKDNCEYAFMGCTNLTVINLPNLSGSSNRYSNTNMFTDCSSLISVNIPSLKYIANNMFDNCQSLSTISLPNVIEIYDNAFNNCINLQELILSANLSVSDIRDSSFNQINNIISVYIKTGMIDDYRSNTQWNEFESNGRVKFIEVGEAQPEEPETPTDLTEPLCFTAEDPGATILLSTFFVDDNSEIYDLSVVTSTDKQNWTPYEIGTTITLENIGDKVYFRAADDVKNDTYRYNFITTDDKRIAASGNLNTLLKADGSVLDLQSYTIDDNDNIIRGECCYYKMFEGCRSLTKAPELPATTLAYGCYWNMFHNCSSLTQAPELPATTPIHYCYYQMFRRCNSLSCININLSSWYDDRYGVEVTTDWVYSTSDTGTFTCPENLPEEISDSKIPYGWTIIHKNTSNDNNE